MNLRQTPPPADVTPLAPPARPDPSEPLPHRQPADAVVAALGTDAARGLSSGGGASGGWSDMAPTA